MRKVLAASAAGLMLAFGLAFTANSAMAGVTDHYPETGWTVADAKADGSRPEAAKSEIVGATSVKLTRDKSDVGTSIETVNLDLGVGGNEKLTVNYALSDGATTAGGAVRMFIYNSANANTNTEAPFAAAIAEGTEPGTLEIPLNGVGKIGTMGLVYDASNGSTGTVTFSNLAVGDQKVLFVKPLTVVTPAVVTEGENVSAATCEADGVLKLPKVIGVNYTRTPATGTGEIKVTATAEEGYKLAEGNWVWTVSVPAKLPADSEACKKPTQSPTPKPTQSPTPKPTAKPCEAYDYTRNPSPGNLCGLSLPKDPNCDDIGYRVTVLTPGVDPWRLDQGGDVGIGCESKPLKFTGNGGGAPEPSTSTSNAGGELPLTGSGKGGLIALVSTGVLMFSIGGILLVLVRRRRDADAVESA